MGHWEAAHCKEKGFDCSLENLWLMAQKNGVVMLNKKKKKRNKQFKQFKQQNSNHKWKYS